MGRRPDESMTLLREVMERPLDPGYAAAARRREQGVARRGRGMDLVVGVVAVLVGFAVTVSVVALRAPEPSAVEARSLLEEEITERSAQADALGDQVDQLDAEVEALRAEALEAQDPALRDQVVRDGIVSGSVAVEGGGLVVTLSDASALAGAQVDQDSRVHDEDLQRVVNSLWQSGAEAISINGRRLTPLAAIRSAGDVVLVDLQPIASPYRITAVGDPTTLQTEFARSTGASFMLSLSSFGIQSSITPQSNDLTVPADNTLRTFYALPVDSGDAATDTSEETP